MNKFMLFTVAGEEFGIDIDRVVEVVKPLKATPLPRVPAFITGVINLRGSVIPLMDLRKRLGVKASAPREKIVISVIHGEKVGLLVDAVKDIVKIDEGQMTQPPSFFKGLRAEYLTGVGRLGEKLIVILGLDSLLSSEEMIMLEESRETLHSRGVPSDPEITGVEGE